MASFKSFHDHNPFPLFVLIFALILYLRAYAFKVPGSRFAPLARRLGRTSVRVLWGLVWINVFLLLFYEYYFYILDCRVSLDYYNANIELLKKIYHVFSLASIPIWLDFATLLCHLRHQYGINVWDHDVDVSMVKPGSMSSLVELDWAMDLLNYRVYRDKPYLQSVQALRDYLHSIHLTTIYYENRDLLQIYHTNGRGPHVDIWFWTPQVEGDKMWLYSREPNLSYNPRAATDVLPLKNYSWPGVFEPFNERLYGTQIVEKTGKLGGEFGKSVLIPNDAHAVSKKEFAPYGGSYMTPQVFRGDCTNNLFNLRFMW